MTAYGVHSEVGKLRKVIVHRPELSMQRLTPSNHDELLFDDVLWVEQAQREHDAFVAEMRGRGTEVFYVQDLLTETLAASDEAKTKIIEQVVTPYTVGWSIVDEVREAVAKFDAATLSKHLIGGLTAGEAGLDFGKLKEVSLIGAALDDFETFIIPPVPNTLFMRDSSCWIYNGVSVNPMYWPARRRESLNILAIYRYHPMFKDADFNWWYPELADDGRFNATDFGRASLEGGDVQPIGNGIGVDRDERADTGPHDRADRESAVRERRRRPGDRGGDGQGPRPHASRYRLHDAQPGRRHRLSQRRQPDRRDQPAPGAQSGRLQRHRGEEFPRRRAGRAWA